MPRYFLTRIKVEGFRGINNEGDPLELSFRPDGVNSVFAVNANGKSSLFEALSYAIRGDIPKLTAMQAQEHPEHYYCNRFHSGNRATIGLAFEPDDGSGATIEICIERDGAGQRTVSSPTGHPDPEAFLSSLDQDFALLDYTTFARFMEDTPLQRGRSFSALLGLSDYSDMRQSLQAASDTRAINSDLAVKVIEAEIRTAQTALRQQLATLRQSFEHVTGNPLEDVEKLEEYAAAIVTALAGVDILKPQIEGKDLQDVDFDAVKETIRKAEGGEKRQELERAVSSIARLEALGEPEDANVTAEQEALSTLLNERDGHLASTRGDLFKRLFQAAETVIKEGAWSEDAKCPLCESDLDHSIREHIEVQLQQYQAVAEKNKKIEKNWAGANWVQRLSALENAEVMGVQPDMRLSAGLAQRADSGELSQGDFKAAKARLAELEKTLSQSLVTLRGTKAALEKELPRSLVQLTEQVEYGRQFNETLHLYTQKKEEESAARSRLGIRERWREFISGSATAFANAEAALSRTTLSAIEGPYKSMFGQIMNVGDVVPDLQRAADREDLKVQLSDFHGQSDLSAQALLSESYRNALAISVFLAAAVKHSAAPRFLVLDDVTSSFDSGHQFNLMELIRTGLQQPKNADGLQFIILSHDGLLQKYFDRHSNEGGWQHHTLQGSPPMGAILTQTQDANRLKVNIDTMLNAGQVTQAYPLIRQYLEFKLGQIIRKVDIPVPIDFAIKDQNKVVSNSLGAITEAVNLQQSAGTLVLDAQQVADLQGAHVPALIGNWVSHYETGSTASFSAPMLQGVMQSIDQLSECFRFDHTAGGSTSRRWYRSLSRRI